MKVLLCFAFFFVISVSSFDVSVNPFLGVDLFVNPDYINEVQSTINQYPSYASLLRKAQNVSVAYWVDKMAKIQNVTRVLNGAQEQQLRTGRKTLTFFIIYDLPDRDCAAYASNGEIVCEDSNCANGLATYQSQYIDPIVSIFRKYPNQPIVALVEPDSLPNLATNLGVPKCAQAQNAYKKGVAYALSKLGSLSNVAIYLDAAHGGWLGWPNNLQAISSIFQQVLGMAGGAQLVRGFATNTANYQPLGSITSTNDPCNLKNQYNFAIDEVHYVNLLSQALQNVGINNKGFIIDTSRNGVPNARKDCSNWCNIKGAGLGVRPTSNTAFTGINVLDAVYWAKVPGESDGTSDTNAPRFDYHCTSQDSFIPAPQAGVWFPSYFLALCQNAQPPL